MYIMPLLPTDYKSSLLEHILPVGFIKDGFITKNQKPLDYSYEDYILELINCSSFFMSKTNKSKFVHPTDESRGQYDAVSDSFSLDFKLILGKSMQYAKNLTSAQIDTNGGGVTYFKVAKGKGEYKGIWLHRVLRDLAPSDLKRIASGKTNGDLENDVLAYLNSIDKEKNLLLFYPVLFEYRGTDVCIPQSIADIMYEDYCESLRWRLSLHPNFETYISFIFDKAFHIALFNEHKLELKDSVSLSNSPSFIWLKDFYWNDSIIKRLL